MKKKDQKINKQLTWTIIAFVTVILFSTCSSTVKNTQSQLDLETDIRLQFLDKARWAMSAHNTQPWEVELDSENPYKMKVFLSDKRQLPATDPFSRQRILSIGGFLAVLEDRASEWGYHSEITLFPENDLAPLENLADNDLIVADVLFNRDDSGEIKKMPGLDALTSATVKAGLSNPEYINEEKLKALNTFDDIYVDFISLETNENTRSNLKNILIDAFTLEMNITHTLLESYNLTRRNRKQISENPYGLSYRSGYPEKKLGLIEFFETIMPMNEKTWGEKGSDTFANQIQALDYYIIIYSEDNSRKSQIHAGMVFERIWQHIRLQDMAVIPASQALQEYVEMEDLYEKIHKDFAEKGQSIQMVGAIGRVNEDFRSGFRLLPEDILH